MSSMSGYLRISPLVIFTIIFLFVLIYFFPILLDPNLVLKRNNDLQEFFWPNYFYVKNQLSEHNSLPFWNNQILSGYPLVSDPQAPLFYPPNLIFLIFPIELGFILSFLLHIFLGGLGIYLCSRSIFKFSKHISIITAFLYVATPRLAAFIEAGHVGQIYAFAWIPFLFLSTVKIYYSPNINWIIVYVTSLAGLFLTHSVTFLIMLFSSTILFLFLNLKGSAKGLKYKKIGVFLTALFLTFFLVSIALLPQYAWSRQTTRTILFKNADVYPKWKSINEFIENSVNPLVIDNSKGRIDTEKWIPLSLTLILMAFLGFMGLNMKYKIVLVIAFFLILLISLNNLSPLYHVLLNQGFYVLLRVSTRVWILMALITIFLSGLFLEKIKTKKIVAISLIIVSLSELLILSWAKFSQPIEKTNNFAPKQVFEFLSNDNNLFRVFCTTRCLSQKDVALYGVQTIEGYNTLVQLNYFKHSWELTKSYYNYYTLAVPPYGITTFEKLQPSSKSLGEYNVKYIISPHKLNDSGFKLEKNISGFLIYKNLNFKNRAILLTNQGEEKVDISLFTPNFIRVKTNPEKVGKIILAEVYNTGWRARTDNQIELEILETPNALRAVDIPKNTTFVDFRFDPPSLAVGKFLSTGTVLLLFILLIVYNRSKLLIFKNVFKKCLQ